MKKRIICFVMAAFMAVSAFAQAAVSPADDFYEQLDRWEALGLVPQQSQLRPYPVQLIKNILTRVSEGDNEEEAAVANETYERLFYRKIQAKANPTGTVKIAQNKTTGEKSTTKQFALEPGLIGDVDFLENFSVGYNLAVLSGYNLFADVLPHYQANPYYLADAASYKNFNNSLESDASFAFCKNNFYFQMGIGHASYGPFLGDNIIFSEDAKHTANFALVYNSDKLQFVDSMFILSANSATSNALHPGKFLFLQSINYNFMPSISAGFLNCCILGKRFDPAYFIPMPFIVTEGVTGYDYDNILMGVNLDIRPVKGLVWNSLFFLDDIGFTEITKYKSIKLKSSFQTNLEYVPSDLSWLKKVEANYTFVTPWMYAHICDSGTPDLTEVNYQTYTTGRKPLATSLLPNSDRISLSADFKPLSNLKVSVNGTFIRHANVNEGLPLEEQIRYMQGKHLITDGGLNNHQFAYVDQNGKTYFWPLNSSQHRVMLLTQETKEYTVQLGFDAAYSFPRKKLGQATIGLGYTFEYIHNYGVTADIFAGGMASATEADVQAAIQTWRNSLVDLLNNYITIYVKYTL